jgi:hypothetical protein
MEKFKFEHGDVYRVHPEIPGGLVTRGDSKIYVQASEDGFVAESATDDLVVPFEKIQGCHVYDVTVDTPGVTGLVLRK